MKRILGRLGNIRRIKGMFIPPRRVELVIDQYENLIRYQLVIDRPQNKDRLTIRIECPKENEKDDYKNVLIDQFKIAIGILSGIEWPNPGTIANGTQVIIDLRKV